MLAILIALILLGGIKRIGQVTEKLVPFMAVMYIVLAIGVVLLNVKNVPSVNLMQWSSNWIWSGGRGKAYDQWLYSDLWWLGIHLHSRWCNDESRTSLEYCGDI